MKKLYAVKLTPNTTVIYENGEVVKVSKHSKYTTGEIEVSEKEFEEIK